MRSYYFTLLVLVVLGCSGGKEEIRDAACVVFSTSSLDPDNRLMLSSEESDCEFFIDTYKTSEVIGHILSDSDTLGKSYIGIDWLQLDQNLVNLLFESSSELPDLNDESKGAIAIFHMESDSIVRKSIGSIDQLSRYLEKVTSALNRYENFELYLEYLEGAVSLSDFEGTDRIVNPILPYIEINGVVEEVAGKGRYGIKSKRFFFNSKDYDLEGVILLNDSLSKPLDSYEISIYRKENDRYELYVKQCPKLLEECLISN